MARGAFAKEVVTEKILKTFERSFVSGKEIRIPIEEVGEEVQIKVTLTCAKESIPNPEVIEIDMSNKSVPQTQKVFTNSDIEFSKNEKDKVNSLLEQLGIK